jgi:hypothetical protein
MDGKSRGWFLPGGEITIYGSVYQVDSDDPENMIPIVTDENTLLLRAAASGFELLESGVNIFRELRLSLTVTDGFLVENTELSSRGRLIMTMTLEGASQAGGDVLDLSAPITITGSHLAMRIDPHAGNISTIANTVTGSGTIECQGATQLIVDDVDLYGSPDAKITVSGQLKVQGTLANTQVNILDAPVMQDDRIYYDDAAGRLVVGPEAVITGNSIYCEGDQFMFFESEVPDLNRISGNEITLVFNQGKGSDYGMLAEARSADVDCGSALNPACETGIYQAAEDLTVRFADQPANNWLLERLEVREGARVNLVDVASSGSPLDAVYVRNLVLHPMSVLNLGYSKLYYENMWLVNEATGSEEPCVEPITPGSHLFTNGSRLINIPLLGFSLAIIHMDDETQSPYNEFDQRVRIRQKAASDASGIGAVSLQKGHRGPRNGVMLMQTQLSDLSGSASSVAAKGTFAPTSSEEMLVEFEYQFVEGYNDDAELIVYLSDSPSIGDRLIEVARIRPPADKSRMGYGALKANRFAAFSGTFNRQDLKFHAGSYVELELRGQNARILIDNWDPQIRCGVVCGDYGGLLYANEFQDYLLLLSEIGLTNPLASSKGCLDLQQDNIVDMDDVLAWETGGMTLCNGATTAAASMSTMSMDMRAASGYDPNTPGLLLCGRQEGTGNDYSFPETGLYGLDPNGLLHKHQSTPVNGRLFTSPEGGVYQVRGKDGIYDIASGLQIVPPRTFGHIKVAGNNNPITDAAFDPFDPAVMYVVPVTVGSYKSAARIRLNGTGDYTIEQLYGGDPNTSADQSIVITNPGQTSGILYEPDTQNIRQIEVDTSGHVYILSSYWGNNNDWLLIYQADDPNTNSSVNLTKLGVKAPSAMKVTSTGKLVLASSMDTNHGLLTKLYLFDTNNISEATRQEIVIDCPDPDINYGLGEKAVITSMAEDIEGGKLYAVGFTSPVFNPDANWIHDIGLKKIFTKPFMVELDLAILAPSVYLITDPSAQSMALPVSIAWKGAVAQQQDPCEGADLDGSGSVGLNDLVILASQWLQVPGVPSADIMPAVLDHFVDMQDLKKMAEHWQQTGCNKD